MVRGENTGLLILVYRRNIAELSQSPSYKESQRKLGGDKETNIQSDYFTEEKKKLGRGEMFLKDKVYFGRTPW